jgi:hypothetical protein
MLLRRLLRRAVLWVACPTSMLSLVVAASAVRAEGAGSVMTEFGLIGTWSPDCSLPPGKGIRTTFVIPPAGPPLRHTIAVGDRFHVGATTDAEIVAAVRTAEDRLRLIQTFTKVVSVAGAPVIDYPKGEFETLIKKEGDQLTIIVNGRSRWRHPIAVVYQRCAAVDGTAR